MPALFVLWGSQRSRSERRALCPRCDNPLALVPFVVHARPTLVAPGHTSQPLSDAQHRKAAWGQGPGPLRGVGQRPTVYFFLSQTPNSFSGTTRFSFADMNEASMTATAVRHCSGFTISSAPLVRWATTLA